MRKWISKNLAYNEACMDWLGTIVRGPNAEPSSGQDGINVSNQQEAVNTTHHCVRVRQFSHLSGRGSCDQCSQAT